jgi:hypothetical protein
LPIKIPDVNFERPPQLAVFLFVLFAAVRWSLMAHRCVRSIAPFWSLTARSGQWQELALNWSVVIDPSTTLLEHCHNGFSADFEFDYRLVWRSRFLANEGRG